MKELVVKLIVDHREAPSGLIDELEAYDYTTSSMHVVTDVEVAQLPVGDVICSDRVAVERKAVDDFMSIRSSAISGICSVRRLIC